jgi:twitching motility two-component system response regulator PilH
MVSTDKNMGFEKRGQPEAGVKETNDEQYSILVVDDSAFMRKRVHQALDREGYNLVEADSGVAALNQIEKRQFDCILMDLVMPEMDGFGLLAEIQRRQLPTPVVVLTADIQKSTRERCEGLGARTFVQKPVPAEQLRSVVAGIIGRAVLNVP